MDDTRRAVEADGDDVEVLISAIEHYSYCPRQCALIHVEQTRVQNSVFECTLNDAQLEQLVHRLEKAIDVDQDSLRIYRLRQPRDQFVQVIGRSLDFDVHQPLIV